ncbi:TPA: hypothetical protein MB374_001527 [Klebsiella pneumoniae]|uniref:hypothetical protein n=1 Tax=Klebsiella variicola TaxID=244366 RepID=UPI00101DB3A0|nr:hypothetical protein [Klebsiella variicola]HBT4923468.1 hypothetical protein [Klebsiella pneumoniae]
MSKKRTVSPVDSSCDANMLGYVFGRLIGNMTFVKIVKVIEVDISKGIVDLEGLLYTVNANGESLNDGGRFFSIPYLRLQRGSSAVVMNPVVGDIGLMVCCDRDITGIKDTKTGSVPTSGRLHSAADGIYLTSIACLSTNPSQYIEFSDNKITIVAPHGLHVDGDITTNGTITASGDVIGAGISLDNHVHGGVASGGSTTSGPQ